jgi:hypothetical protein
MTVRMYASSLGWYALAAICEIDGLASLRSDLYAFLTAYLRII